MPTIDVLKEVVDALVVETLRGFNLEKFKSLPTTDQKIVYASNILPEMGEGSSRIVFAVSGGKALKIATNPKGLAQNEAEIDIFTNPKTKPVVARIFDADQQNEWIISEIVQPFPENEKYWQNEVGVDWNYFSSFIREWVEEDKIAIQAWMTEKIQGYTEAIRTYESRLRPEQYPHSYDLKRAREQLQTVLGIQKSQFLQGVIALMESGLEAGDLIGFGSLGHYGKTVDGRIVVLDYGFTKNVADQHYRW